MKDNLKSLNEKKASYEKEMEDLLNKVKTEDRAFTDEENDRFTQLESDIKLVLQTVQAIEKDRKLTTEVPAEPKKEEIMNEERNLQERAIAETKAFEDYIRGVVSERADVDMTVTDNGAVIPATVANKIIEKVVDISPIFKMSERYNVSGTLTIPSYDETTQEITCAYASEFTELESTSGKMSSISLTGFLAGALTKIAKSLINNSKFDIVNFVIKRMAIAISKFIEKELIKGTTNKIAGLSGVTQNVTTASATAITADELIDVQDLVPDEFQESSIWLMNRATRKAIRKLKDENGQYLLNKDITSKFGYVLLGRDVYCSDNIDTIAGSKVVAFYGDLSGLATKISEDVSIEVLREKFATQHAVGVVGFIELDAKVQHTQKLAKLTMKSAS